MEEKTPLTRSSQLTPLSREHYDGLLFVWRLRQGIRKGAPVKTMSDFAKWFWKDHLQSHFENEEKLLLPFLPPNDEPATKMLQDHEVIKKHILGNNSLSLADISRLATLLHDHIRYEERELFPHIESTLTPEQLNAVAQNLNSERPCSQDWTDEFWKD